MKKINLSKLIEVLRRLKYSEIGSGLFGLFMQKKVVIRL